jgi:GTPase SAR1 family protein
VGMLQFFLSPPLILSRTGKFVPPAADCINGFVRLFSEFQTCGRSLAVLERKVQANEQYLPPNFLQQVLNRQQGHRTAVEQLKVHLAQNIQAVRGGSDPAALWTLLAEFQGDLSPKSLGNLGASFRRSIDFITKAVSQGARYVGHNGLSLSRVLPQDPDSEAYVFFFTQHSMESDTWLGNQELLFELLNNRAPNVTIAIVDCEVTAINFDKVRIGLFQGGQEITQDYLEYKNFIADKCFALCDYEKVESKDIQKPIQRRHVTIACPGPKCTVAKIREWICPRCEAPVEFGFSDQYIYCDCGRSLYSNYLFKCNNDVHGPSYLPYDPKKLLQLLQGLLQSNYLNILILGETGVGKSTFINALVNYLEFDTLDEAMAADKLNYVIPCSFSTQLMDRENPDHPIVEKRIKIGARDDEKDGSTGDSATQRTTVYPVTFNMGDSIVTVRLIDTPGMGDTRGVDFDRQNMADILSTLSGYDELHGILILLKSNAARLTITFSYCVKELLTHLHHNASKNMAFGFTNTRISNYTPGDTYGPLKALLFQHPDIGLELKTPTTYCFDSESFRYLAAFKSDITMPNKLDFDRSWKHSRDESIRLINHFKSNPPHKVKNTLSLNGARQVISELTKPMAEITQVIESNIAITEDKVQELQDTRLSGDQLRNRLMVQKVQMKAVPLDMHRTVCGNGSCTDLRSDGKDDNTLVTVYKSHCHPICWLSDVPADQLAPPGLIKCAAFDGANCKECGHHWQEHLHVLYELVEETVTAKDNTIEAKLRSHSNDVTLRETALAQHEQRISEYKQEREIIRDAAAKFGVFLRKYSLAPYNDALIAYMDYRIKEEQMKVQQGGNDKRLLSLTEERHKHKEAIEVIMRHMNSGANWDNLSEAAIDRMVNQLFNLKHFGSTLKNLKQGISTAHQSTYREISYTVRRKVPGKTIQKKPVPVSQAQTAHTHHMAQEIVQQTSPAYGRNYSHSHTHAKPENTSFVSRFRSMF